MPSSPEEMVTLAVFSRFKWALTEYIRMGIVTPEVPDYIIADLNMVTVDKCPYFFYIITVLISQLNFQPSQASCSSLFSFISSILFLAHRDSSIFLCFVTQSGYFPQF